MHFTCFTLKKIGQASTWRKYKLYIRVQLNEIYHVGCFLFSFENFVWPPFCFFPTRMRVCERHRFTLDSWSITPREPKSIKKKRGSPKTHLLWNNDMPISLYLKGSIKEHSEWHFLCFEKNEKNFLTLLIIS